MASAALPGSAASSAPPAINIAQALRDLHWLLTAAPLLRPAGPTTLPPSLLPGLSNEQAHFAHRHIHLHTFDAAQRSTTATWLRALTQQPQALHDHLVRAQSQGPGLRRLGHWAEALLGFFLAHGPGHRLLAQGWQLHPGELDFLLETRPCPRQPTPQRWHWHWELAVKFYLWTAAHPNLLRPEDLVGPDGRDRLDIKLTRLLGTQLQRPIPMLGGADDADLALRPPWQRAAVVKGWLFWPAAHPQPPTADWLHPDAPHGWWAEHQALTQAPVPRLAQAGRWRVVPRHAWIGGDESTDGGAGEGAGEGAAVGPGLHWHELAAACDTHRATLLVANIPASMPTSDRLHQAPTLRLMVVPTGWPHHTTSKAGAARLPGQP